MNRPDTIRTAILIIYSFLLGSIPFGSVIADMKGIDLRKVGSGNIGATNVLRAAGKGAAFLTLLGDMLKGVFAVALAKMLGVGPIFEGIAGIAAIAGHNFSLFLKFRGGKGVATSLGVILIYMPQAGILTVIAWLIVVVITRYSSLGAILSLGSLPLTGFLMGYPGEKLALAGVISALIIIRHLENIKRLIKGTERRIGEKA